MLTSLALVASGVLIVLIGVYFWNHPQQYYKYLHGASIWSDLNARPPEPFVKFGAALTVIIGVVVALWGLGQLLF
jgi:hypothetical protein